jgi:hypothetical protein
MPIRWYTDHRAILARSIDLTARQAGFNPRLAARQLRIRGKDEPDMFGFS